MALPQTLNTATPASSDSPSGAPALFANIKQFIVDVFGITDNTAYAVKAFSVDPTTGVVTINVAAFALKTMVLTQGAITDPALMLSGTATWNDAADTFTAWKLDVTNTNSAAASLLMDLRLGGATMFSVRKDGLVTLAAALNLTANSNQIVFDSDGAAPGTLSWAPTSSSKTLTLPDATDTLVGKATTDTLTNKTLTSPALGGTVTGTPTWASAQTFPSVNLSGTSNQLVLQSAGVTGTLTWTPTASGKTLTLPDITDTLVGKTTTDTLTNKTLTNPTINSAAVTGTFTGAGAWQAAKIGTLYGGTNIDSSGSTGVPTILGGTWSVAAQLTALRGGTGLDGSAASNGQLLIGNGAGYALATLTAGANQTITNGAGTIQVDAVLPESKYFFFEDFPCSESGAAPGANAVRQYSVPWFCKGNNALDVASNGGVLKVIGDTSRAGTLYLSPDGGASTMRVWAAANNIDFRTRFAQIGASAGTRRCGFSAAATGFEAGDPASGIFFRFTVGGTVFLVARSATVESTLSTGITASTTMHAYRVVITTTLLTLYVDGALIGTLATNIPSATLSPAADGGLLDLNQGIGVDYFWMIQDRPA